MIQLRLLNNDNKQTSSVRLERNLPYSFWSRVGDHRVRASLTLDFYHTSHWLAETVSFTPPHTICLLASKPLFIIPSFSVYFCSFHIFLFALMSNELSRFLKGFFPDGYASEIHLLLIALESQVSLFKTFRQIRVSTFCSCWRLGNPHGAFPTFSFSVVRSQENLSLIRLGVAL